MDNIFLKIGSLLKCRYSALFKGGGVLIGLVLFAWSDTLFKLIELEDKQNSSKFFTEVTMGVSLDSLDCNKLTPTNLAINCASAIYYEKILEPIKTLFFLITNIFLVLGFNMMLLSIFGLIFEHSGVKLSYVLSSILFTLVVNVLVFHPLYLSN
ncbi:hypothetical protein ACMUMQ_12525 [Marinomonas sp. 2405UD66-6]|uniref:hypothetical protein n=1 Tax=Marinomonas sp. 2405UD66-6 TaxID=3391834 RepID=UPI0039C9E746